MSALLRVVLATRRVVIAGAVRARCLWSGCDYERVGDVGAPVAATTADAGDIISVWLVARRARCLRCFVPKAAE